jgi:transcriptional regulator GlxA family with amidase domain
MTEKEIKQILAENERLKADNARLQSEMIRLVGRNLDLTERLEADTELRRRAEVARTLMEENIKRQHKADLQDDGQLMAMIDLLLEEKRSHLNPDFDTKQLAELLSVSQERLIRLFRNKSIYRTPEAYIDNLRTLNALRLLRTQPNFSIAAIAEASGFNHVRTMQRRIMDVAGMTPADYRALFTQDP